MRTIVHTPGTCGGSARIDGTRIAVWLVQSWSDLGMTPEQLVVEYPFLSKEDIEGALAYTREHPEEIADDIAENA